jgi:hypothetical protein
MVMTTPKNVSHVTQHVTPVPMKPTLLVKTVFPHTSGSKHLPVNSV